MTTTAKSRNVRTQSAVPEPNEAQRRLLRFLPAWIILAFVMTILLPNAMTVTFGAVGRALSSGTSWVSEVVTGHPLPTGFIAPLFTAEIQHWSEDIARWAGQAEVDPNLLATVMQIESCGLSDANSSAGAQGLFQVMPMHFTEGEVYTDPETNARRGANVLRDCLQNFANGDPGLALACYNGGPGVTMRPFETWPAETQRYYNWGTGIYADATQNLSSSQTLNSWLEAGGIGLCSQAAQSQGRQPYQTPY